MNAPVPLPEWTREAACLRADPDIFFLDCEDTPDIKAYKVRKARKVCADCPVLTACRLWGLEQADDRWGIYGAMTPADRRKARKEIEELREEAWA